MKNDAPTPTPTQERDPLAIRLDALSEADVRRLLWVIGVRCETIPNAIDRASDIAAAFENFGIALKDLPEAGYEDEDTVDDLAPPMSQPAAEAS
jgi:hypothetical protein